VLEPLFEQPLEFRCDWKCSSTVVRPGLSTSTISSIPDATASSTTIWIAGLSTTGRISFGITFDAGSIRVPIPAATTTALRTFIIVLSISD
jgi:hypothetical protein